MSEKQNEPTPTADVREAFEAWADDSGANFDLRTDDMGEWEYYNTADAWDGFDGGWRACWAHRDRVEAVLRRDITKLARLVFCLEPSEEGLPSCDPLCIACRYSGDPNLAVEREPEHPDPFDKAVQPERKTDMPAYGRIMRFVCGERIWWTGAVWRHLDGPSDGHTPKPMRDDPQPTTLGSRLRQIREGEELSIRQLALLLYHAGTGSVPIWIDRIQRMEAGDLQPLGTLGDRVKDILNALDASDRLPEMLALAAEGRKE